MRSGKYILVILLSICTYAKYEIWEHLALTNAAKTLVDNYIQNIEKEKNQIIKLTQIVKRIKVQNRKKHVQQKQVLLTQIEE